MLNILYFFRWVTGQGRRHEENYTDFVNNSRFAVHFWQHCKLQTPNTPARGQQPGRQQPVARHFFFVLSAKIGTFRSLSRFGHPQKRDNIENHGKQIQHGRGRPRHALVQGSECRPVWLGFYSGGPDLFQRDPGPQRSSQDGVVWIFSKHGYCRRS